MPIVFVHGVPESDAIWDPLVDVLGRDDVIRLSPPGFGAPLPDGFEPHRQAYVSWLVDQLAGIEGDVDLVGHDWGAGHVAGAMSQQPELVRSWVIDVAGLLHPDYVWHDMAQLWRTPGVGEETVAGMMTASLDDRTALLGSLGMPDDIARRVAAANDETMGRCILALYRSAGPEDIAPLRDALPTAARRPGLVLIPTDDHYAGTPEMSIEVADLAGAGTTRLEGLGHWWMLQDPEAAVGALRRFWSSLG